MVPHRALILMKLISFGAAVLCVAAMCGLSVTGVYASANPSFRRLDIQSARVMHPAGSRDKLLRAYIAQHLARHPESTVGQQDVDSLAWQWGDPKPNGDPMFAVAYGDGITVAVGVDNIIWRSSDGKIWTQKSSGLPVGGVLEDVIYAGGQFVAVTDTNTVITSPDGISWTDHATPLSGPSQATYALAYGNNTYVALGTSAMVSSDGVTWTQASGISNSLMGYVIFADNKFVAVGYDATDYSALIEYSADGHTWTEATGPMPGGLFADLLSYQLAWNGSVFVATGQNLYGSCNCDYGVVLTSADGINWTQQTPVTSASFLNAPIALGNTFYTFGMSDTDSSIFEVYSSTDGVTWIQGQTVSANFDAQDIAEFGHSVIWTGTKFVAVDGFITPSIYTSTDYTNWTDTSLATSVTATDLLDVIYADNQFVAVGGKSSNTNWAILTSPNGVDWKKVGTNSVGSSLSGIAFGNSEYVAVGQTEIATSSDGTTWNSMSLPSANDEYSGVAYGNGKFVLFGNETDSGTGQTTGVVYTSPDGSTWTKAATTDLPNHLSDVAWTGAQFVAVANPAVDRFGSPYNPASQPESVILASPDGSTWTAASLTAPSGEAYGFNQIIWTGSQLMAIGGSYYTFSTSSTIVTDAQSSAVIATSADGSSWTVNSYTSGPLFRVSALLYDQGTYLAAQGVGIYASADGASWSYLDNVPSANWWTAMAVHGPRIVAVGRQGNIVYAGNTAPVVADGSLTTKENTSVSGTFAATDAENDPLSFSVASAPAHGTVKITDVVTGAFTYTPASGYSGSDSFTFKADDGQADSSAATESVTVKATSSNSGSTSSGGGGGTFGWLGLLGLTGIGFGCRKFRLH